MTFKRIKCPTHQAVVVARIDLLPDGKKVAVFWTRALAGPNRVLGGRAAEDQDETRLALEDPGVVRRIARGRIPYVVTWCARCRGELVIPMDWLQEEAKHSGTVRAPIGVLKSAEYVSSAPYRRYES